MDECLCVYMYLSYVHVCATVGIWRSVSLKDQTQDIKLVNKHLYPLRARSHVA